MRITLYIMAMIAALSCSSAQVVYDMSLSLLVPRVYDNYDSLGRRKYQRQKIVGTLVLDTDCASQPSATMSLTNATHKVGGFRVSYETDVNDVRWHMIGNNRTGMFPVASICLSFDALPSCVQTCEPTDDESLVLMLAGRGTEKRIHGYAAGTIGCGCAWYGHTSPTRIMWTDSVVDTAAVYGTFTMKKRKTK